MIIKLCKGYRQNNKIFFPLWVDNSNYEFFFEYNKNCNIEINSEGLASIFYCIAKYNNIELIIEDEIDDVFCSNLVFIDQNINKFSPKYDKNITYKKICKNKKHNNKSIGTITFGLDSLYTTLLGNPSDLIYVIGMDINYELSTNKWIEKNINYLKEKCKYYFKNKKLIVIKSNVTILLTKIQKNHNLNCEYTYLTNGFAIYSCVINMLDYNKVLISGPGFNKNDNLGHINFVDNGIGGSTNFFKIEYYDNNKINKIKFINNYDKSLLNNLRICINYGNCKQLNCLKCRKCIRMSLILSILNFKSNLINFSSDEIKLHLDKLSKNKTYLYEKQFIREILELFKEKNIIK